MPNLPLFPPPSNHPLRHPTIFSKLHNHYSTPSSTPPCTTVAKSYLKVFKYSHHRNYTDSWSLPRTERDGFWEDSGSGVFGTHAVDVIRQSRKLLMLRLMICHLEIDLWYIKEWVY